MAHVNQEANICSGCKQCKKTKKCGGCKFVYYCSRKCQTDHWKHHKAECKKLRKQQSISSKRTKNARNSSFADNMKRHYDKENKKQKKTLNEDNFTDNTLNRTKKYSPKSTTTTNNAKVLPEESSFMARMGSLLPSLNINPFSWMYNQDDQTQNCGSTLFDCDHFNNLHPVMTKYNYDSKLDSVDIEIVLNDYLHLMYFHDHQHEQIFSSFQQECDLTKCVVFKRNNKPRDKNENNINFRQQILDKIHCYLHHAYDTGYRMRNDGLGAVGSNQRKHHNDQSSLFTNSQFLHIKNHTSQQHNMYHRTQKFKVDLSHNYPQSENKGTQHKMDMFECGVAFTYHEDYINWNQYLDITADEKILKHSAKAGIVPKKFATFKEELISNPTATLFVPQWDSELSKAKIHFGSKHCKQLINTYETAPSRKHDIKKCNLNEYHLLSVMVYCNYDVLQYEFSKTYRKENNTEELVSIVNRHSNFYHLGRNLQCIVNELTSKKWLSVIEDINIKHCKPSKVLYHGLNQQLLFPLQKPSYTKFRVPLSTTSELSVAVQFATVKGIIIEISAGPTDRAHLECAWLSDFPNEKEHLFINTKDPMMHLKCCLPITNITLCENGVEVRMVIDAVNRILLKAVSDDAKYEKKCRSIAKLLIEDAMEIQSFKSLHPYARNLFNHFRNTVSEIEVYWDSLAGRYEYLSKYLKLSDLDCVDIERYLKLFPNLEEIALCNWTLSNDILQYILSCVRKQNSIQIMRLCPLKNPQSQIKSFMKQYKTKFNQIGYKTEFEDDNDGIIITNKNRTTSEALNSIFRDLF
eukprot:521744_1